MMSEIEKFIKWVDDQVHNHGLIQISGVHLNKGGTAMDILREKSAAWDIHESLGVSNLAKKPSLEDIAGSLNKLNDLDTIHYKPYVDNVDRKEYQGLWELMGGSAMLSVDEVIEKSKVMELQGMDFLHKDYTSGARGDEIEHVRLIFIDGVETVFTAKEFEPLMDLKFSLRPSTDHS